MENKENKLVKLDFRSELGQLEENLKANGFGDSKVKTKALDGRDMKTIYWKLKDFIEQYPFNPVKDLPLILIHDSKNMSTAPYREYLTIEIKHRLENGFYMNRIFGSRWYENVPYPYKDTHIQINMVAGLTPQIKSIHEELEKADQYREQINSGKVIRYFEFNGRLIPKAVPKRFRRRKMK